MHSKESVDKSMSSGMENEIKKLETDIDVLKKRIEYLEQILDQAGIPYDVEQNSEPKSADNSVEADNLMPYIIPETITPKHANYFYSFFKGRTDVYSKRSGKPNPKTGKTGYYTQCWNYWKNGLCPKREGKQIKCGNCENQKYKSLTGNDLLMHLRGDREDCSDIFPAIIRQTFDVAIYDICSKKRSKTEPVCFCRIKETVKSVLRKIFLKRAGLLLHIHTSSDKNVAEFVTKQGNR